MKIDFKVLSAGAKEPSYAHNADACFDLSVVVDDDNLPVEHVGNHQWTCRPVKVDGRQCVSVGAGKTVVFGTGLAFGVPEGHVMMIFARSSTGFKKQLALTNGTGIIDSGYTGEVRIALTNIGITPQVVFGGDRVAQAMIIPVPHVTFGRCEDLGTSERGDKGIGSTGA